MTISLPRRMRNSIVQKIREGRSSAPGEYLRPLIPDDRNLTGTCKAALPILRGVFSGRTGDTYDRQKSE